MKFFCLVSILFFTKSINAQSVQADSISEMQLQQAIKMYDHFSRDNAPVYNGPQYIFLVYKKEGDPYFESGDFSDGWVNYNGRKYDSLKMIYDVARNQVVVLAPDKISAIALHNEFVDSFSLRNHVFIKLEKDYKQNLNNAGFYDLLYNGKIRVLARRLKEIDENIQGNDIVHIFYVKDHYYIFKDGLYYLVGNKKDLFRLFHDQLHDVKKFIRKHHLKFKRKSFEEPMLQVAEYYDHLTH